MYDWSPDDKIVVQEYSLDDILDAENELQSQYESTSNNFEYDVELTLINSQNLNLRIKIKHGMKSKSKVPIEISPIFEYGDKSSDLILLMNH